MECEEQRHAPLCTCPCRRRRRALPTDPCSTNQPLRTDGLCCGRTPASASSKLSPGPRQLRTLVLCVGQARCCSLLVFVPTDPCSTNQPLRTDGLCCGRTPASASSKLSPGPLPAANPRVVCWSARCCSLLVFVSEWTVDAADGVQGNLDRNQVLHVPRMIWLRLGNPVFLPR